MINLHDIASLSRRAEIGYWIAGDCRRRGYAFEAAVAVIDFGFGKAGLNRIVGKCTADNVPSAALMKKLGMTYEGCHRKEIYIKDRFADIKVFAVLKEEW